MNELKNAASPYLAQHADNPVHWRMWSAAALADAKRLDKPILLSIGYAACHWCHVMAHESFEDPATAEVMNALYVNIKVDREERPDIDHIYMSALHTFGERGGWPLTMFLTPDAEPFWGGTYFPNTARYGQPAFTTVLRSVEHAFRSKPDQIAQNTKTILGHLAAERTGAGSVLTAAEDGGRGRQAWSGTSIPLTAACRVRRNSRTRRSSNSCGGPPTGRASRRAASGCSQPWSA